MMKAFKIILFLNYLLLFCSCSSVFYVSDNIDFKGKKVGIYKLDMMKCQTYEKLPEVSQMQAGAFYPYLVGAGFQVYKLQL